MSFSYSIVNYLYVNCSGSITSVDHVVSARRGFFFLLVLATGCIILL